VTKNLQKAFTLCTGKYVTFCEGDDYWTNENKLQQQVAFLEENTAYIMCCHDGDVYYQKSNTFGPIYPKPFQNPITSENIITMGGNLCPTSSIVFRNQFTTYPDFMLKSLSNDRALTYFLMLHGKFWFINQKMCVYRVHAHGLIAAGDKTVRLKYLVSNIELMNNFAHFCSNNIPLQKLIHAERANLAKNLFYFGNVKHFWHYKKYIRPLDWIKILVFKLINRK
jgi:glycosyltransferase involved in cell wall biosynthesis